MSNGLHLWLWLFSVVVRHRVHNGRSTRSWRVGRPRRSARARAATLASADVDGQPGSARAKPRRARRGPIALSRAGPFGSVSAVLGRLDWAHDGDTLLCRPTRRAARPDDGRLAVAREGAGRDRYVLVLLSLRSTSTLERLIG